MTYGLRLILGIALAILLAGGAYYVWSARASGSLTPPLAATSGA